MLIKSGIVTQISGSLGGLVGAHGKSGLYFRARAIPTNPNTPLQQAVRNYMASLTSAWQGVLTAVQRSAWAVYAENVTLPNPLGDAVNVGGMNMFIRSNVGRLQSAEPQVNDGPAIFNLGEMTSPTFAASAATGLVSVTFDNTDAWANEDDAAMLVYCSSPKSPTINYFDGPYRYIGKVQGDAVTAPTSPADIASGHTLTAGQKLFCQVRVSRADGRLTSKFQGLLTVAA